MKLVSSRLLKCCDVTQEVSKTMEFLNFGEIFRGVERPTMISSPTNMYDLV